MLSNYLSSCTDVKYLCIVFYLCNLSFFIILIFIYASENVVKMSARAAFLRAARAARALHLSAAAGVSAARRAKSGDGRAAKLFFARGAFGACWRCSKNINVNELCVHGLQ